MLKLVLSKAKTAIILLLITIIFLSFYAFMVTRPISYGLNYRNETVYDGMYFEGNMRFYRDGTMRIDNVNYKGLECFYYNSNGYTFFLLAQTEEEAKEEIAYIEENFEELVNNPVYASKMNAFIFIVEAEDYYEIYACKAMFVFAITGGLIAVPLIILTGSSLVLSYKAKRGGKRYAR